MPISNFILLTPLRRKALTFFVQGKRPDETTDDTTTRSFPLLRSEIAQRHPVLAASSSDGPQKVSIKKGVFAIQTFYAPNTASYPLHKFKTTWSKLTPHTWHFLQMGPKFLHQKRRVCDTNFLGSKYGKLSPT